MTDDAIIVFRKALRFGPHVHPGILILNINDPANPTIVGEIPAPLNTSGQPVGVTSRELRVWPSAKLLISMNFRCSSVGRDASAETDVSMRAEILSYSRARGLFAGISLEGSTIRPDNDANKRIYGEKISAKDIVLANETQIPSAAEGLISSLNARTPKHKAS